MSDLRYVDYNIIQQLQHQCKSTGDWNELIYRLDVVFGNLAFLSNSFARPTLPPFRLCSVDKIQARETLNFLVKECPSGLPIKMTELLRLALLETTIDSSHFNALVIAFQCALCMDTAFSTALLPDLCKVIANLSDDAQDILCRFLVEPAEEITEETIHQQTACAFRQLLQVFHDLIRTRSILTVNLFSPNTDAMVINATKCLAMMYRLNECQHYVPYVDFYNDTINDHLDIKEDFPMFKENKGFSLWNYSFILNPVVKADILKVESVFQMRHELQDAFFRALFQGVNSPYLVLEVRRDHIIQDTLQQLEEKSIYDLRKQLRIQFIGEEAVDEGGVQKEFFQLIVRELFDAKYGMFALNEESRLYWFVPNPAVDELTAREYKLVGLLLGLAVYNSITLDLHFPPALYKKLMNVEVGLEDLEQLDPSLARGLRRLLSFEGETESEYDRSFQVDIESYGHIHTYDLIPNGVSVHLTRENKKEFVDLYVSFTLNESVKDQFDAFQTGFALISQDSAIKIFRPEELEQLICGSSELDFDALEKATVYDGGWTQDSPIIRYFWEIVREFSYEEKKKLLFFATGSDRAPIGGLGKLQFVIAKNGADSDRLPTSHTCYNVLLLCEYSSKEKLKERLLISISNAEGFGMI